MRHLSVLTVGLMTTTILTGLCAAAQTERNSDDQPQVNQLQASPSAQTPPDGQELDRDSAASETQPDKAAQSSDTAESDDQSSQTMKSGSADNNGDSANTSSETADTSPAADTNPAADANPTADANPAADTSAAADSKATNEGDARNSTETAEPAEEKTADQDFGRLSQDGSSAFDDIHMARVAIFDGNTEEAAKLISDAQEALNRASTDSTSFLKAESALSEPSGAHAHSAHKSTSEIVWLPIDGQIVVGESYKPTTDKAAAMVSARKNLQKGQADQAMNQIRLAAIDVDYTLALVPLQQSIADLSMANKLIGDHDYYAASQALKQAEDGIRYDEVDDVAHVKRNAGGGEANSQNKG